MTPDTLRQLPANGAASLPPLLRALWLDAHGDWAAAHALVDHLETPGGTRVHAYLHRKEGDTANSRYWYARAGHPPHTGPLEDEWTALAADLLATPLRRPPLQNLVILRRTGVPDERFCSWGWRRRRTCFTSRCTTHPRAPTTHSVISTEAQRSGETPVST